MRNGVRKVWFAAAVLSTAAVVATGCSSGGSEAAPTTSTTAPKVTSSTTAPAVTTTTAAPYKDTVKDWPKPELTEGNCPMPLTDAVIVEVTCGTVEVPENRLDPNSRMITLAVARLHSTSADPKPDPVVQLEGGPGFPSLEDVDRYSSSAILDERDYILWDQRGTGYSAPNLDCTETNDAVWKIFATTDPAPEEGAVVDDSLRACRKRLVAEGVDLDGYDTTQNAADLADIRVALGIDEWNLRGVSYGSALAMETVRKHPEGIKSVLLDSIVPPDAGFGGVGRGESALASFDQLYKACAADTACAQKYGPLKPLFDKAAASLDADPYRTKVVDPADGVEKPVAITGQDLWAGLFNAMYDETLIPALPGAAKAIAEGDRSIIASLAESGIPFAAGQTEGMTASVDCADRQRLLSPDVVDPFIAKHPELGALVFLTLPETGCPEWDVKAQPKGFNELLREDEVEVPIMVMAGRFDPVTPVAGSKRVAEALGVDFLLFPNAGHGAVTSSDCARDIWFAFLDDPEAEPDTSCMQELGPLKFG